MKLIRTFHAVGQGAFYTERFYEGDKNVFNAVYDCGTSNKQKVLLDRICSEFEEQTKIDYCFISHFHNDHISGIKKLQKQCVINNYVIPAITPQLLAESTLHNYFWVHSTNNRMARFDALVEIIRSIMTADNRIEVEEGHKLSPLFSSNANQWIYYPYNPSCNSIKDIIDELKKHSGLVDLAKAFENKDFDRITEVIKKADLKELINVYRDVYGGHHCYVMPVYSGYEYPTVKNDERVCLYTGDYDASDPTRVNNLLNPLYSKWEAVGTFQVPHHGSKDNSCQDLYNNACRIFVISSYGPSRYQHPHNVTLRYICERFAQLLLVGTEASASMTYKI